MTTFPFTPSNQSAPTFQPTLDENVCTVVVTWNLFGQRYYVNCYGQDANLVFTVPLIESPPSLTIQTIDWDGEALQVAVTTAGPHGFSIGQAINLTISFVDPSGYDGTFFCNITGPNSFTYPLNLDPGAAISVGAVSYLISMSAGYFASTLVFRSGQFEVTP